MRTFYFENIKIIVNLKLWKRIFIFKHFKAKKTYIYIYVPYKT